MDIDHHIWWSMFIWNYTSASFWRRVAPTAPFNTWQKGLATKNILPLTWLSSQDDYSTECRFWHLSKCLVQRSCTLSLKRNPPVTQGQGQVTLAWSYYITRIWNRSQKPHREISNGSPNIWEYCKRTVNNFGIRVFAHCHQEHRQNEVHNKVHLCILFCKRNTTFHGAFLLRLSLLCKTRLNIDKFRWKDFDFTMFTVRINSIS